jgi:hypothetical protein
VCDEEEKALNYWGWVCLSFQEIRLTYTCFFPKDNNTMNNDFKIYRDGERFVFERVVFPRLKGYISKTVTDNPLTNPGSCSTEEEVPQDVCLAEEVELLEDCSDEAAIDKAIQEAGEYIIGYFFNTKGLE